MGTIVSGMSYFDSIAAKQIRQAITNQETNRHALSRQIGMSYTTLNRKLDAGGFTLEDVERIASALHIEPVELLTDAA
jgi:DNA-binding NtrC family response regulator